MNYNDLMYIFANINNVKVNDKSYIGLFYRSYSVVNNRDLQILPWAFFIMNMTLLADLLE